MSCEVGSWCDFILWFICFSITCGILAIFFTGVVVIIEKIISNKKENKNE